MRTVARQSDFWRRHDTRLAQCPIAAGAEAKAGLRALASGLRAPLVQGVHERYAGNSFVTHRGSRPSYVSRAAPKNVDVVPLPSTLAGLDREHRMRLSPIPAEPSPLALSGRLSGRPFGELKLPPGVRASPGCPKLARARERELGTVGESRACCRAECSNLSAWARPTEQLLGLGLPLFVRDIFLNRFDPGTPRKAQEG